jgi:hypothetical protein
MYAKLFSSIYQGTLRGDTHGLVVFTNLLAHADQHGWADIHPKAIAEETGLTLAEVEAAIRNLESPDPESRSPEEEGKRLIRLDEHRAWGWRIVNHGKYRAIRNEEDRREQNRLAQERWRNKHNQSKQRKPESAHTEAEADTDTKAVKKKNTSPSAPSDVCPSVWADWLSVRKAKKGGPVTQTALKEIQKEAAKAGLSLEDAIRVCCKRSWVGFDASWMPKQVGADIDAVMRQLEVEGRA